jgi:hypothetical protein
MNAATKGSILFSVAALLLLAMLVVARMFLRVRRAGGTRTPEVEEVSIWRSFGCYRIFISAVQVPPVEKARV